MAGFHLSVKTTETNSGISEAKMKMTGKVKRLTYLKMVCVICLTASESCRTRAMDGKATRDTTCVKIWLV